MNPYDPNLLTDIEIVPGSAGQPTSALPRLRYLFPVMANSFLAYILATLAAIVLAAFVVFGKLNAEMFGDASVMEGLTQSPLGFPLIVILPQFAMIVPVVLAARLSPLGIRERLRFVRGEWPLWAWVSAAVATPLIGMISSAIVGLFMKDSEALEEMSNIFRELADAGFLLPLALLIGATPGICEELLFRGYLQSRLTARFGGTLAAMACILFTATVFAAFHMDLVHSTAVFALGVWLGWISWHSGSIFPAMIAHFLNNFLSVVAVSLGPEPGSSEVSPPFAAFISSFFLLGLTSFAALMAYAWQQRAQRS